MKSVRQLKYCFLFLVLIAGLSLLISACGEDDKPNGLQPFLKAPIQTASFVIQLNGLEILRSTESNTSNNLTEIPVKLRTDNTITIQINNDNSNYNPTHTKNCDRD